MTPMASTLSTLTLFFILSTLVSAAPLEDGPLHKLELRKLPDIRDGEHPHMAFQRHQNQALKRLHHFVGQAIPDEAFFEARTLQRRADLEDSGELDKRLWFPPEPTNVIGGVLAAEPTNDGVDVGIVIDPSASSSDPSPTVNQAAAATTTITSSGSNANGFPQAEESALNDGTITDSSSSLVKGGLAYDIEFNDVGYIASIDIGTPSKSFSFLMDTGSGDTWVPSTSCGSTCGGHTSLGSDTSSTFQESNTKFTTEYGSGAVTGIVCEDTMTIAGMTLSQHEFGVSTQETSQFGASSVPFDGLMGLSFSSLSQQHVPTPIDSLASSGDVKQAILGIALGRVSDGSNDGEIVFGQADSSKFDPSTTQTLEVTSTNGFWQIPLSAVSVNGNSVVTGRQAILDTGTSLMVAPSNDAAAFHAQIQGSKSLGNGMFSIPCTTNAQVFMTFGSAAFQVDVRDLLFQPVSSSLTGDCVSALSAGTVTDDQTWLLGDAFLKNVYMTTNVQDKTVQLSARTDAPDSSTSGQSGYVQTAQDNAQYGAANRRSNLKGRSAGLLTAGGVAAFLARNSL